MEQERKPRIYLRKIQPLREPLASEETMIWIWMGVNPEGKDWSLGSAGLFTLAEAWQHYKRKLRRAGVLTALAAAVAAEVTHA